MDSSRPTIPPAKSRSLAHGVVSYVADLIKEGRIAPGEKVPSEAEIIRALGVSRSVVREAISHMQAAGMVETRQGVGTFVLARAQQTMGLETRGDMSKEDVLSLLELRISLETEAAGLAANRRNEAQLQRIRAALDAFLARCETALETATADTQFHLSIAQAAGNHYLQDVLGHINKELLPRARQTSAHIPRDAPEVYIDRVRREHEDIYSAIARQDAESARAAMRTHLSNSRERLRRAHELYEAAKNR
ncbi:FadR/GntR family transcriptional regulator [Pseudoduganella namucuonensis]|uniref:Transcriptional regulator, GntR family n=1 Tax=Pseudoduganella namucuonensis TaxID=1035707 RepID=A0A1I7F5F5_9BURK|nr:FadR/GntR family transcriptional regulator [Pseudoduganella namucuonensis]SFU31380.1 transcriptional regulator, GntR family [Pseudoduganella namucuonensis]